MDTSSQKVVMIAQIVTLVVIGGLIAVLLHFVVPSDPILPGLVRGPLLWGAGIVMFNALWSGLLAAVMISRFFNRFGWWRLGAAPRQLGLYLSRYTNDARKLLSKVLWMSLWCILIATLTIIARLYSASLLFLAFALLYVVTLARTLLLQPAIAYLASSKPSSVAISRAISSLRGYHVCSYLDQATAAPYAPPKIMTNYNFYRREDAGDRWVEYVSKVLSIAPYVLLDLRAIGPAVQTEIEILKNRCGLSSESRFIRFLAHQTILLLVGDDAEKNSTAVRHLVASLRASRAEVQVLTITEALQFINREFGLRYLTNDADIHEFVSIVSRSDADAGLTLL